MADRFDLSDPALAILLRWEQDGVVSRRQLLAHGATDNDIRRLVRRNALRPVHAGVYVDHTGELTLRQRQWAAVLAAWPAALARESALPIKQTRTIHLAVASGRRVNVGPMVVLHRNRHLAEQTDLRARPPRLLPEHALLDVMSDRIARDDIPGAFGVLAEVTHGGHPGPQRLLTALASRKRVAGRRVIEDLIADRRDGACSVLERGYLHRVERAHGLPNATRQHTSRATGRRSDQDVRYDQFGVIVELDGRAFHDNAPARDDDARRDLAELATSEAVTARVTYGLVFRDACRTAAWIARILRRRGWTRDFQRCPGCTTRH
jgi:hypothetical protein